MNIIKVNEHAILEKVHKEDNFLTSIFDRVFLICKNDPAFSDQKIIVDEIDGKVDNIKEKLARQTQLLEQSTSLKQDLARKIRVIEDENYRIRAHLLEALGSEI